MKNKSKLSIKEKFKQTTLVGCCFHSIGADGKLKWQGRILSSPKVDWYLVQLYSWAMGEPCERRLVNFQDIIYWILYKDEAEMRYSAKYGSARHLSHDFELDKQK